MSKLFDESIKENLENNNKEKINNKTEFLNFIDNLLDSIFKNKDKYLEIILEKLNEQYPRRDNNGKKRDGNILIILNNIDSQYLKWIEKKNFSNLNILFIFNLQDNFEIFQSYYFEEYKFKQFFLENNDKIIYKDPKIKQENDNHFYSIFQSKEEYEKSRKEIINQILQGYKSNNDKLLNIRLLFNFFQYIKKNK